MPDNYGRSTRSEISESFEEFLYPRCPWQPLTKKDTKRLFCPECGLLGAHAERDGRES